MDESPESPLKWKTPEQVMKFHRLKRRLNQRTSIKTSSSFTFSNNSTNSEDSLMEFPVLKRKFPFPINEKFTARGGDSTDSSGFESCHSDEKTLFNELEGSCKPHSPRTPTTFSNIINRLTPIPVQEPKKFNLSVSPSSPPDEKLAKRIPIDWSLKSKMRFMSTRPFGWSASKRTSEDVSAITGFVRCLDPCRTKPSAGDLDTSPNAQFHRCCLYWQHPHLPWLPLFSRNTSKLSSTLVAAQLQIAETLHQEWTLAFKSLIQLLRTQKCPYFYIIGTQFHCLFRAAGMAGLSEPNALIAPTTRGFRKMLQDEDISFTMPLRREKFGMSSQESQDGCSRGASQVSNQGDYEVDDDDDDEGDDEDWMDSVHIRKLTNAQKIKDRRLESRMDGNDDSLVMVAGADLQSLFNLLVNCKNNMDRLPPTLVAPTAFQLATLKSCQVRDAVVQVDGVQLHSLQIEGPIMPHALSQMCLLLTEANAEYSAAVATVKPTNSFTSAHSDQVSREPPQSMVFLKEYLSDCGLSPKVLSRLCESDPTQFGLIESIEPQQML